ncbi:hypothetical protein NDN11_06180 [Acinetobacter sp. C26M]|uniref:DUF7660 family protein n=1 Tax=unclassified Acinetobacter TaxID=196816 RepID=UPI002036DE5D|nr:MULTISPECIES: hypothetical protein [unclassified Acinetobacter]USA47698.1 hypothetical protein NDN11_06180 [Acinetobacter sp. C26M]USA51179.1 hypothetical protein NDN12_06180 [Acinetobacter sp. C26G]
MNKDHDSDHLDKAIDAISSHTELAIFIKKLRQNLIDDPNNWENINLSDFLDALASWTEDMEGYYKNIDQSNRLDKLDWKVFAEMLMAARIYE